MRIGSEDPVDGRDRLLLSTLHRSKGLEASRVILAGTQRIAARWHGQGDARERALWERRERCLLYVGMTRARDWCALTRVEPA